MQQSSPAVRLAPPVALRVPRRAGLRGVLGVHPGLPLVVVGALFVPRLCSTYWTFNVMAGFVLGIACLGLVVVVGWAREISLAQAGLTGSAVYLTGYFSRDYGSGYGHAYPFSVAAGIAIAFVVGLSFVTAFVSMRLAGAYVIVLTLALQFLLENTLMLSERLTGSFGSPNKGRPDFFGHSLLSDSAFYFLILGSLVVSLVFLHRLRHSRFGRSMLMVGADQRAASAVGVSPWRYRVAAFCVAGFFAGLAGALSAPLYISPPGTLQYISFNSFFYLSIPVLAGFDSLLAVVGVAVLFTLVPQLVLSWKINVYLLGGVGLLAGVFLGPRGLGGAIADVLDPPRRSRRSLWPTA